MNRQIHRAALVSIAAAALAGCSGIVHTSDAGGERALQRAFSPGYDSRTLDPAGAGAEHHTPDVLSRGNRVLFVRREGEQSSIRVTSVYGGDSTEFPGTSSIPGHKFYTRWSRSGRIAFGVQDGGDGLQVVVLESNGTPVDLGRPAPRVTGGMDFADDGTALIYSRDGGLFLRDLTPGAVDQPIEGGCAASWLSCTDPVVSHGQATLAYKQTLMLSQGWVEFVRVVEIASGDHVAHLNFGPGVGGGGHVGAFDFSPDDTELVIAIKPFDQSTMTYADRFDIVISRITGPGAPVTIVSGRGNDRQPASFGTSLGR